MTSPIATTTAPLAANTHYVTQWNAYPQAVRDALTAQGHTSVPDAPAAVAPTLVITPDLPFAADVPPVVETVGDQLDCFSEDLLADAEADAAADATAAATRIFANTVIKIGNMEIRIKAAELTSAFHMQNYKDGKPAGDNQYMKSLVSTIEKHGLQAVVDKMTITTTLSASGEGLDSEVDLMAQFAKPAEAPVIAAA